MFLGASISNGFGDFNKVGNRYNPMKGKDNNVRISQTELKYVRNNSTEYYLRFLSKKKFCCSSVPQTHNF